MARKKTACSNPETVAPQTPNRPTINPERYYLHPRDMTLEERFELITDIFANAFVEQRLADFIAGMQEKRPPQT
jgi:hypothetical protein